MRAFRSLTLLPTLQTSRRAGGNSVEVILTGGTLRKNSFSLVGPLAEETLRRLSADLLFLAVDGFDVRYGLTTPNLLESRVNVRWRKPRGAPLLYVTRASSVDAACR